MESEIYWNAVTTRDARFDGAFVFAVKTTGIFCRPSCGARRPKRENVEFFEAVGTAESCGFRACLRCRPESKNVIDPGIIAVLRACRMLERESELNLTELSDQLGLSPA